MTPHTLILTWREGWDLPWLERPVRADPGRMAPDRGERAERPWTRAWLQWWCPDQGCTPQTPCRNTAWSDLCWCCSYSHTYTHTSVKEVLKKCIKMYFSSYHYQNLNKQTKTNAFSLIWKSENVTIWMKSFAAKHTQRTKHTPSLTNRKTKLEINVRFPIYT